jgi:hypothetical protein
VKKYLYSIKGNFKVSGNSYWTHPEIDVVLAAEGEQRASRALKQAADIMIQSPAAIQLRYLQTLNSIAGKRNSTIDFTTPDVICFITFYNFLK